MINPDGIITATYDKIHMFDVVINADESYQESATYQLGERAVMTPLGDTLLGMTICYDLRFPQLYQDLAKAGASVMFIPSAFTVATGKAHWEILLRARAIETGSFVIAAAQTGTMMKALTDHQGEHMGIVWLSRHGVISWHHLKKRAGFAWRPEFKQCQASTPKAARMINNANMILIKRDLVTQGKVLVMTVFNQRISRETAKRFQLAFNRVTKVVNSFCWITIEHFRRLFHDRVNNTKFGHIICGEA